MKKPLTFKTIKKRTNESLICLFASIQRLSLVFILGSLISACGEEEEIDKTPEIKTNIITIEGKEYPIQYLLVEELGDDRMLEIKSYLNADSTEVIAFYADLSYTGSGEIPVGNYTFAGPMGLKRSGYWQTAKPATVLYNSVFMIDIISSVNLQVSGEDAKNIKVKGTINYDQGQGVQKIIIDYNGPYIYD